MSNTGIFISVLRTLLENRREMQKPEATND
jgi:hypothetical protein